MFDAFGGDQWWPLNCQVAVIGGAIERLMEIENRLGRAVVGRFYTLGDAVASHAPYPFGRQDTQFLIGTADGRAAAMSSAAPNADTLHRYAGHAQRSLHTDCVAAEWVPANRSRLAGAGFDHFRYSDQEPDHTLAGRATDQLSVQVTDQGGRWVFTRVPVGERFGQRGFEQPDVYRARKVADRLPLDLIRRYWLGAGVPVDDPGFLAGPVVSVSQPKRVDSDLTWSNMAQLRAMAGYRPVGIETDLGATPHFDDDRAR